MTICTRQALKAIVLLSSSSTVRYGIPLRYLHPLSQNRSYKEEEAWDMRKSALALALDERAA